MPTIQEKEKEYRQYIDTHRANVKTAYDKIVRKYAEKYLMPQSVEVLDRNIERHDADKDIDFIFDAYRRNHFPVDEKEKQLADKDYEIAWTYHSKINPHHWQFFLDDDNKKFTTPKLETEEVKEIYKLAYLEMLADWLSFSFKKEQDENKDKDEKLSVTGDSLEFETWYSKNKNEIMIHPDMKEWFDRIIEDVITDIKENKDTIFTESMSFNRQDRRHEDSQSYLIQTDKGFVHFLPNQTYQIVDDPTQASIGYNKDEMRMMLIGLLRKYSNITAAKLTNLKDVKKDKKEEMNGYEQEVQEDNEELELINNVEKIKEIREAKTAGIPNKYQDRVRAFYKGADGYWVIDLKQGWYTEYGTNYIRNKSKRDCLYELSTNTFNKTEESMKEDGIEIDGIKGTITNSGMAK